MTSSRQLHDVLLQSDEEFRQLSEQHHELDTRLGELLGHPYPSGVDEIEKATLKKRKLAVKDRMERILRRHRSTAPGNGTPALGTS